MCAVNFGTPKTSQKLVPPYFGKKAPKSNQNEQKMRLFLGPFLRAIFLVDFLVVLPCALAFPEAPSALEKASGVGRLRL